MSRADRAHDVGCSFASLPNMQMYERQVRVCARDEARVRVFECVRCHRELIWSPAAADQSEDLPHNKKGPVSVGPRLIAEVFDLWGLAWLAYGQGFCMPKAREYVK
jgi:hypothetical protein